MVIPAICGFILGIVDVSMKSKKQLPKGKGIAGIVMNSISIVIILLWTLVFAAAVASEM